MKIKSVKKIKNVTKGDIILLSVGDQNDAGVYSDITGTNVISIVEKVKIQDKIATVLVAGGYEFSYPKNQITFFLGKVDGVEKEAEFIYKMFNESDVKVKEINNMIEMFEDVEATMKVTEYVSKKQKGL